MVDASVPLDFMENYARVRERLYGKPKQVVVSIPRKKEEEPKKIAPVISIGPFQQAINELKEDEKRMKNPLLNGLKGMKSREVLEPVILKYKISYKELSGPSRVAKLHQPRRHCFAVLRDAGFSTPQIGRLFNRDHSTVVHALQMWEKFIESGEYTV